LSALLSREEYERIPPRHRWLLKLVLKFPNPSFPYFLLRKFPEIEGVFWTVVVPVFMSLYFLFNAWLIATLSLFVSFPFNILLGLSIPAIIFLFFLRIQLERTIHWWRNLKSPVREWDISKATKELIELLREQQKKG